MLEHDTAVLDKLGDVMVGTTIIENDWALKWQNALGGIASLEGKVDVLEDKIDALPQELPDHGAQITEPPRVYRRVKLSKDEPYDTTQTYPVLYG